MRENLIRVLLVIKWGKGYKSTYSTINNENNFEINLKNDWNTNNKVKELLSWGSAYSTIEVKIAENGSRIPQEKPYYTTQEERCTKDIRPRITKNLEELLELAKDNFCEFVYIFDDKEWFKISMYKKDGEIALEKLTKEVK